MTEALIYYFSEDLREQALVKEAVTVGDIAHGARSAASAVAAGVRAAPGVAMSEARHFAPSAIDAAKAPFRALHPGGKYLKKGWDHLSNVANPQNVEAMKGAISSGAQRGHQLVDTASSGTGVVDRLRAGGWLSNTPKYVGAEKGSLAAIRRGRGGAEFSKLEKAKNMAMRAMPGQKALHVLPAGAGAVSTLRQKEDPETGRKIGLGERVGGAAMGAATGLVAGTASGTGVAGSMVGSAIGERVGAGIGKTVGRSADVVGTGARNLVAPPKKKQTSLKVPR